MSTISDLFGKTGEEIREMDDTQLREYLKDIVILEPEATEGPAILGAIEKKKRKKREEISLSDNITKKDKNKLLKYLADDMAEIMSDD